MTRACLLFVLVLCLSTLLLSCMPTQGDTTTSKWPNDTTAYAYQQARQADSLRLSVYRAQKWPPDTISVSFTGPGEITLSSPPLPGPHAGWTATYRLTPSENVQGGTDTTLNVFRTLINQQTTVHSEGTLLFVRTAGRTGK